MYINQMVRVDNVFTGQIITFIDEITSTGIWFTHLGKRYFELFANVEPYV